MTVIDEIVELYNLANNGAKPRVILQMEAWATPGLFQFDAPVIPPDAPRPPPFNPVGIIVPVMPAGYVIPPAPAVQQAHPQPIQTPGNNDIHYYIQWHLNSTHLNGPIAKGNFVLQIMDRIMTPAETASNVFYIINSASRAIVANLANSEQHDVALAHGIMSAILAEQHFVSGHRNRYGFRIPGDLPNGNIIRAAVAPATQN